MADQANLDGSQKLFVGNLPYEATTEDLQAHFSQLGEPILCMVTKKGQGVVGYSTADEAKSAAEAFNGSEVGGNAIQTVVWSKKFPAGGKGKDGKGKDFGGKGFGKDAAKGKGKGGWGGGCGWGPMGMGMDFWNMDAYTALQMKGMLLKGLGKGLGGKGFDKGWGNSSWDNSKSSSWEEAKKSPGQAVTYHKLSVSSAALTSKGLTGDAPALQWAKGVDLFGSAGHIISMIVKNVDEVEVEHDADWEKYPEIGEAWKAAAGEEDCFAIAHSPTHGVWGVGIAAGWKGREAAAKLALAVAIVEAKPGLANAVKKQYPEFFNLTKQTATKGGGQIIACAPGNLPEMREVTVPASSSIVKGGFSAESVAIHHEGKQMKDWFTNAHSILSELVENISEEVEFEDDPEGEKLPEVHAAWTASGGEEACLCVAKHAGLGLWAVGVASGWKNREAAAKMALALAAAKSGKSPELVEKTGDYPEFGQLVTGLESGEKPTKRRKK